MTYEPTNKSYDNRKNPEKVIVIGDFMLNVINSCGSSKSKKVIVKKVA